MALYGKPPCTAGSESKSPWRSAQAAFEVGDFFGATRDFGKVHDVHVTFMLGFPGIGDFIRSLGGDESD